MKDWKWVDYATYEDLFYCNPNKALVGAYEIGGRVFTKWSDVPLPRITPNAEARRIISQIAAERDGDMRGKE